MQIIPKSEYDFYAVKQTSLNEISNDVTKAYFDASTIAPSGRGFKGQAKKIGLSIKQYLQTDWTLGVYGLKVSECVIGYMENFIQISDSDSLLYKSEPKFYGVNENEPVGNYDDSRYGNVSLHATISFLDYPIIGIDEKVIWIQEDDSEYNARFNFTKNNEVLKHTKPCRILIEKTTYDENDLPITEQYEKQFTVLITARLSAQVIYPEFDIYTYDIDPALGTVTESGDVKNKTDWSLEFADWSTGNFYFWNFLGGTTDHCKITIDKDFKVIQQIFSYDYIDYLNSAGFQPETTAYDFDSKTGQLPKKMLIDNFLGENTIYEIEGFPKSWPLSKDTISGSDEARVFIWSGADPLTIYAVLRDGRGFTKILLPDELTGKTLDSFIVRGSDLLVFYSDNVKHYVASFYFAIYIEGDTITQDLSLIGFNRLLCYSPQLQKGGIITKVK